MKFVCRVCGFTAKTSAALGSHMRIHESDSASNSDDERFGLKWTLASGEVHEEWFSSEVGRTKKAR